MNDKLRQIDLATRDLVLTNDQLEKVSALLLNEFNEGLKKETNPMASVKMLPTYVRDVPNGKENGKFLALDLGGTNFRVLLVELNGHDLKMDNQVYSVPRQLMLGTGEELFDYITECLATFMEERGLKQQRLPLGFTFSFPCHQEGLVRARLVQWSKGFACSGVEGQDVVHLLRQSISKRQEIMIEVMAVVNDTTGTLISCAHKNHECRVGVILGTGTNACYTEKVENIEIFDEEVSGPSEVIINTEWGAFGDNGVLEFVRTVWDEEVDIHSLNKGQHLFEKMISGMYLGELVGAIIADLSKNGLLLNGLGSDKPFQSSYVSDIESDSEDCFEQTDRVMNEMGWSECEDTDLLAIKMICKRISTRAAHLVSAAVATILNKMKREHTVVGVDGSLYRHHPHIHYLMQRKIAELTHSEFKFDLMLSEDGSGRGAALVAAVALRQLEERRQRG